MNSLQYIVPKFYYSLAGKTILVFFLYIISASFTYFVSFQPSRIAIFWIDNALIIPILIRSKASHWFPFLAASFFAYIAVIIFLASYPIITGCCFAFANCLEIFLGAWIFRSVCPQINSLDKIESVLKLLFFTVLISTAISALIGASIVVISLGHADYWLVWRTWFMGDATGIELVAPGILAWTTHRALHYGKFQLVEIGIHLLCCIIGSMFIFGETLRGPYLHFYFIFPLLLWSALRFDIRITTLSLFIFAVISASFTTLGHGPFAINTGNLSTSVINFQLFFGITTATVLAVSALVTERNQILLERESLIHSLEESLLRIKTLKGLIPICCHCKKIRDDKGYWNQLEFYISQHSDAEFSHGICPDCAKEHYPKLAKKA